GAPAGEPRHRARGRLHVALDLPPRNDRGRGPAAREVCSDGLGQGARLTLGVLRRRGAPARGGITSWRRAPTKTGRARSRGRSIRTRQPRFRRTSRVRDGLAGGWRRAQGSKPAHDPHARSRRRLGTIRHAPDVTNRTFVGYAAWWRAPARRART